MTNPRIILLSHDTVFTAYFEEAYYTLDATAEPEQGGTVTGSGTFRSGDTATLTAQPNEGYLLVGWNDGDTTRLRQLEMTQDTAVVALFRSTQGIAASGTGDIGFTLTPNPTQGRCRLEMAEGATPRDNCWATMTDAQGREVMRKQVVSQKTVIATDNLASGVYLVTLSTPKGSVSQRLLVK